MTLQQLNDLLDYLDANLESCDPTTKLTNTFLRGQGLDEGSVLPWLADHGGYCDCEVLSNCYDFAESFRAQTMPPIPRPRKKRSPRDLTSATVWDLTRLPRPWRIANLFASDEPLRIQMGKKAGCTITVLESAMPPGDQTSDDYWSQLWYERTELPERSPIHVVHTAIDLPGHLRSTLVQTPRWTSVYCWIVPVANTWFLEVRTESNRLQGDLQQISKLVTQLETDKP
jgi:hypothetical protein